MLAYILAIVVGLSSLILFTTAFTAKKVHRKDDFLWSGLGLFYALVLWVCAGRITGAVLLGQTAAATLILAFGWQTLKFREALLYPEKQQDILNFSVIEWLQNRSGSASRPKLKQPIPSATQPPVVVPTPPEPVGTETLTEPIVSPLETIAEVPTPPEPVGTETPTEPIVSPLETVSDDKTFIQDTVETFSDNLPPATEEVEETVSDKLPPATFSEEAIEKLFAVETETKTPEPPVVPSPSVTPPPTEKPKKGFSFKNLFGFRKPKAKPTPTTQLVPEPILDELDDFDTDVGTEDVIDDDITKVSTGVEDSKLNKDEFNLDSSPIESEVEIQPTEAAFQQETPPPDTKSEQEFESFFDDTQAETIIDTPKDEETTEEPQFKEITSDEETIEEPQFKEITSDEETIEEPQFKEITSDEETLEPTLNEIVTESFTIIVENPEEGEILIVEESITEISSNESLSYEDLFNDSDDESESSKEPPKKKDDF